MFEESDIIYAYTWDDACNDGTFVNVSGWADKAGFSIPVAITSTLYERITTCKDMNLDETWKNIRVNTFLMLLAIHIKDLKKRGKANDSRIKYYPQLSDEKDAEVTEVWVNIEARSPKNPEPVMTIMLPSDY